jgi:hypothetical protein
MSHNEVRLRCHALATRDLLQADTHRLLIECRFFPHTPTQIDGLKAAAMARTQLPQTCPERSRTGAGTRTSAARCADEDAEGAR